MSNKKRLECKVLKVYYEKKNAYNDTHRLQIVQYGDYSPTLEAREYYVDEEGKERWGRSKGLTIHELLLVVENLDEIVEMMKMKPEHKRRWWDVETEPVEKKEEKDVPF
jgi:hypothetical protein